MSEILSQAEIDALLSALTSGEVNAEDIRDHGNTPRVRSYDFRRAMRYSKDHIRIISRIHEHFARLMTTHLSGQLRSIVQLQLETVDQIPYEEFIRSIPSLTVIHVFEFQPLEGKAVVEMNPQVVFAILDRFMGGVVSGPYRERELTEIEVALLGRVLGNMSDFFAESWNNVATIRPRFLSMESNPQFLQLATPNETVLVVTLSAKVGSVSGLINVCIPHVTIEPIIPKLSTQYFMDGSKVKANHDETASKLTGQVENVLVEASVVLGRTDLTLQELIELQVGDVIPLHTPIAAPAKVYIEGVPTYTAAVGRVKDTYAVKIIDQWKGVSEHAGRIPTLSGRNRRVVE